LDKVRVKGDKNVQGSNTDTGEAPNSVHAFLEYHTVLWWGKPK